MSIEQLHQILNISAQNPPPPDATPQMLRAWFEAINANTPVADGVTRETITIGPFSGDLIRVAGSDSAKLVIYYHGGGFLFGSSRSHLVIASHLARAAGATVLSVDYRLAPEHPAPTAADDAYAAYLWALDQGYAPGRIAISGDSAGGNLALLTALRARDDGKPLPAALVLMSPALDFAGEGASHVEHANAPLVDAGLMGLFNLAYLGAGDRKSPLVTPFYSPMAGLPPVLIHVGTWELLHSDSVTIAGRMQAAGVEASLQVWDGMCHSWQLFAPFLDEGMASINGAAPLHGGSARLKEFGANNSSLGGEDMNQTTLTRRHFGTLMGGAALAAQMTAGRALAATETVKIGFVGPRSGPLGVFGDGDPFLMAAFAARWADGIEIGGKTYAVEIVLGDTQSDPVHAAQVTKDLINGAGLDLMITASTPETVNPVADACEAAGMPCLSTTAPWEAFYFGRGGVPGEQSFKWTYHMCFGMANFVTLYDDQWQKVATNRRVGVLIPSDADGNAIRAALLPGLQAAGWEIVDPGPYENGSADFTTHINAFKAAGVEIINTFPFPPDFPVFWRQAAQQGLAAQVKVMQMAKAGLFAPELEALGELGIGLHAGAYWHPEFPFASTAVGMTNAEIASGYEAASGKQWNQQVGATAALLDAALAALAASGAPKDKAAVAAALASLKCDTAVGPIDFSAGTLGGAVRNCCETHLVGVQWNKAAAGPWQYQLDIVSNADHPSVPTTATMTPYQLPG